MKPKKLKRFIACSEGRAIIGAIKLIEASVWFEFTPLPGDEYELKIKNEAHPVNLLRGTGLLQEIE